MKSCTMRISSMHGHLDLVGDTTGETESGTLSEHTDFEVTTRYDVEMRFEAGHHANARACGMKRGYFRQKGSSELINLASPRAADRLYHMWA